MWVFCCGMERSASTLQFQIAAQLVEESCSGKRVGWVEPDDFPKLCERYADYDGWKVCKTHICTAAMISEFDRQNAVAIYIFRDLRDVFVSMMRKYSATFDRLWSQRFLEHCVGNFEIWTSMPRVLVSKYEEVMQDLVGEVERIADHLAISFGRRKYELIASDHSFSRQKERVTELTSSHPRKLIYSKSARFDPHSLLHTNHIRSGEIGEWKRVLSPKQVALIEYKARDWLIANGYQLGNSQPNLLQRIMLRSQ